MANPTTAHSGPGEPTGKKASRVTFYVVLTVVVVALMLVARIMGMPKGVGVQHEPQETAPAPQEQTR